LNSDEKQTKEEKMKSKRIPDPELKSLQKRLSVLTDYERERQYKAKHQCNEYDWKCYSDLFQKSLSVPVQSFLATKRVVSGWKPVPLTAHKVDAIRRTFGQYSIWLNYVVKELDQWFASHPQVSRFPDLDEYKIQFLNWVCRGILVPHSHVDLDVMLPGVIPLKVRRTNKVGPLRYLLHWYFSVRKWSGSAVVEEALKDWSVYRSAPSMDFFLLWATQLYQESWCEKKLQGVYELLTIANEYSQQLLHKGRTHYSHPECRRALQEFEQTLRRDCPKSSIR
jgi:hypothetical protein